MSSQGNLAADGIGLQATPVAPSTPRASGTESPETQLEVTVEKLTPSVSAARDGDSDLAVGLLSSQLHDCVSAAIGTPSISMRGSSAQAQSLPLAPPPQSPEQPMREVFIKNAEDEDGGEEEQQQAHNAQKEEDISPPYTTPTSWLATTKKIDKPVRAICETSSETAPPAATQAATAVHIPAVKGTSPRDDKSESASSASSVYARRPGTTAEIVSSVTSSRDSDVHFMAESANSETAQELYTEEYIPSSSSPRGTDEGHDALLDTVAAKGLLRALYAGDQRLAASNHRPFQGVPPLDASPAEDLDFDAASPKQRYQSPTLEEDGTPYYAAREADDDDEEGGDVDYLSEQDQRRIDVEQWAAARSHALDALRAQLEQQLPTAPASARHPRVLTEGPTTAVGSGGRPRGDAITPEKLYAEYSRVAGLEQLSSPPFRQVGSTTANQHNINPTTISSISNISPEKTTMSVFAELYGTPTEAGAVQQQQQRAASPRTPQGPTSDVVGSSPSALPLTFSPQQPSRSNQADRSDAAAPASDATTPRRHTQTGAAELTASQHTSGRGVAGLSDMYESQQWPYIPGSSNLYMEEKVRRRHKLRQELDAKEMAECTFHPTLSPGTRAMARMQEASKLEEYEQSNEAGRGDASINATSFPVTMQSVYDRLYPAKLTAAAARKYQVEQDIERKRITDAEMVALRVHCRAPFPRPAIKEPVLDTFLSNVLGADCRQQSYDELVHAGVLVASTYKSPMAVALAEERVSRKRLAERRKQDLLDNSAAASGEAGDETQKSFRIALFDEFLLRQNAYFYNRDRTVKQLEKELTPEFIPKTTQASTKMVKSIIERSVNNESPDVSRSMQADRARGIPVAGALVKKHKSSYVDPCTFKPRVSVLAKQQHAKGRGERCRFEDLYNDHKRTEKARKAAAEKAKAEELEKCSFKPTNLNSDKNVHVESMLHPKNYGRYEQYLRAKKEEQEKKKVESSVIAEQEEESVCTFRPRTTKKPVYISKMAESFGLMRQQDVDF